MVAIIPCPRSGCDFEAYGTGVHEHGIAADLLDIHLGHVHQVNIQGWRAKAVLADPDAIAQILDRIT